MARVSQILNSCRNNLLKLVINWSEIAGASNREIMIPSEIQRHTLIIAVPNGMVAKTFVRFKPQLISNVNRFLNNNGISDIRFTVDASRFKKEEKKSEKKQEEIKLSPEDIAMKRKELEAKGISAELSESMAKIELIWQQKKQNNAV